jgi:hypothetical protein
MCDDTQRKVSGAETEFAIWATAKLPDTGKKVKTDVEVIGRCTGVIVDRLAKSKVKQELLLCVEWIVHVRQPTGLSNWSAQRALLRRNGRVLRLEL